ncbi:MAG: hypothetical protein SFU99_22970 [Saprospiraceae bacterium]|nr:hypothetical protein [Saprospiraceae bacterium]
MEIPMDIAELYQKAEAYHQQGDVYNAVKLCKRIIKSVPEWHLPYALLGNLYKYQRDWKATLHYNKKTVALNASDQTAWWNIGIAATALKKERIKKNVWNKFGLEDNNQKLPKLKSIRISFGKQFDILWVRPIDPVRGIIESIPSPASERRFRDVVLIDGAVAGYNVVKQKKYPVYEELGVFKRSHYRTFSCQIYIQQTEDIASLEKLCQEADLGFENWSNLTRVFVPRLEYTLPEYYGKDMMPLAANLQALHIAIAAPTLQEAEMVLRSWQVISLGYFGYLSTHL